MPKDRVAELAAKIANLLITDTVGVKDEEQMAALYLAETALHQCVMKAHGPKGYSAFLAKSHALRQQYDVAWPEPPKEEPKDAQVIPFRKK